MTTSNNESEPEGKLDAAFGGERTKGDSLWGSTATGRSTLTGLLEPSAGKACSLGSEGGPAQ
jgi:hypothetical protein